MRYRNFTRRLFSVFLFAGVLCSTVLAIDWTTYRSNEYGFEMLVPSGTKFAERDFGSGWGALVADADGVKIYAVGKLGEQATAEEIESFGVKVTAIPASAWKAVDSGRNSNGWSWYKGVEAWNGDEVVYGGYGVGPRGSYLLLVKTTGADYSAHESEYRQWFDSLTVF